MTSFLNFVLKLKTKTQEFEVLSDDVVKFKPLAYQQKLRLMRQQLLLFTRDVRKLGFKPDSDLVGLLTEASVELDYALECEEPDAS